MMKTPTITPAAIETEVIARETAANGERKAIYASFNVARACYGSVENYVELIEMQLTSSAFEIVYSNEGYSVVKRTEQRASFSLFNVRKY